ncbi:putative RNA-binding protein C57A7.13 [Pseudocercospora fuligena]|uniref:Putative RNA-binding protein C57A7.13 n=1 Tax=Pseudocercospora fuligena TaxID=685502 RepID=A0A8H6VDX1_9PEZI|nr:putative RNA-binding protein C57A7.13 [Pseudocercospora fuligena]
MDSYRPGDNDPGIQIRGAANNRRASDSRPTSSSRRPYNDPDMPSRQRYDDHQSGYRNRSDDRYDNSYSSSSDYHGRNYHERGHDRRDYYSRDGGGRRYESRGYAPRDYPDYHDYHDFSEQDPYSEPQEPPASTGEEDISYDGTALQFLLIRGLKNTVDEALLSKGLEKLDLDDNEPKPPAMPVVPGGPPIATPAAPPGATPGSLKRVFLIRDRLSEKSLSYGFAEYHTFSDAKAALAKAGQLADKCTIASKQIMVDFPHAGVFPISEQAKDPRFTFQLSNGTTHRYRDDRYYASAYEVNMKAPVPPKAPAVQADAKSKTNKKRSTNAQALDTLDSDNSKRKKVKSSATQNLAIATLWGKKQAELNGEDGVEEAEDDSDSNSNHPTTSANPPNSGANLDFGIVKDDAELQSFVAPAKNMGEGVLSCYLCYTNLKPPVTAEKHVMGSKVHKQNSEDPEKLKLGFERMEKAGVGKDATIKIQREGPSESADAGKSEYRDRAKERRQAEAKMGGTKVKVSLKEASKKQGAVEDKPVAPSYGKGKKMLQNAGWEEGKGLGSGGGIAAPIEQSSYAAGVGLGHESSKKGDAIEEAARLTKGGDFLEQTKNVARERFSRMG